jgi:hypothetical protein
MNRDEVRTGGAVLLFNAFALVALFFILSSFFPGKTGTVVVNEVKIYYNSGWLTAYFIALAATLVMTIVFGSRKRVVLTILGVLAGSLLLLDFYNLSQIVNFLDSFGKQGLKVLQDYLPHLAAVVGTLVYWGLLSLYNWLFR